MSRTLSEPTPVVSSAATEPDHDAGAPRPRRRSWKLAAALTAGGLLVASALAAVLIRSDPGQGSAAGSSAGSFDGATTTATVEQRDLVDRETVDGTLGHGDASDVSSPREGTLTALPAVGTVVDRGQSLFEVDGRGVPLLFGAVPMYRALQSDVDDGADVRQLEENLAALGFGDSGLRVDDHFDGATARAVARWQKSLGLDQTGAVAPEDLVFQPGPVRVSEHATPVGGSVGPGGAAIRGTGTTPLVTVDLEATRQSLVTVGEKARVELPDGAVVDATIFAVGSVASRADENSAATIDVTLVLDDPSQAGTLSEAPVTVDLERATAQGALAVPAGALLALAEGGYAVEVVRPNGERELVAVELGVFADGYVAVTGELEAGDDVVMPA